MKFPTLELEKEYWQRNFLVAGIDEVGRGAFAGPLVVGGVILKPCKEYSEFLYIEEMGINDSKKLSPSRREKLAKLIESDCLTFAFSTIPVHVINDIGIGKATQIGMQEVIRKIILNIKERELFILTDAFEIHAAKGLPKLQQKALIHGDALSISIAAASIIAKVYRDELMCRLSQDFSMYQWDKNKGYGTADHRDSLRQFGPTIHHRKEFIRKTFQ